MSSKYDIMHALAYSVSQSTQWHRTLVLGTVSNISPQAGM